MTIQQQMAKALGKDETKNGTWNSAILEGIKEISAGGGTKIEADDSKATVEAFAGGTIELTGDEFVKINGVVNYTASVTTTDDKETIILAIEPNDVENSILYFKTSVVGIAKSGRQGIAQSMEYAVLVDDVGTYTQIDKPTVINTITSLSVSTANMSIENQKTVVVTVTGEVEDTITWNVYTELVASKIV